MVQDTCSYSFAKENQDRGRVQTPNFPFWLNSSGFSPGKMRRAYNNLFHLFLKGRKYNCTSDCNPSDTG